MHVRADQQSLAAPRHAAPAGREAFHFVMIKPSHYDDDGYVIQWAKSWIPSNSLASVYGLAQACRDGRILGDGVDLALTAYDETNTRIKPKRIIRRIRRAGGRGLVGLIGVQTNQFPRAMDIARPFRAAGIPVCIGGFHVSGCMAMLEELPPEIREAQGMGISIFCGEAEEGRLATVLRDAYSGAMKPLYDHLRDMPDLLGENLPMLPHSRVKRTIGSMSSFDAGRGCPFQCSFCTIINVQGRKSRFRSADDIERIVRGNVEQGVTSFFITDDNLARNKQWEAILDRLIALRNGEGLPIRFMIQVDTLCHKIPNFVEKAARAGVDRVFIGLESINPESLAGAKKRQNRITEYRTMLQAWKAVGARTYAGYILGFPNDTPETIVRDIRIVQRELPLDMIEFFNLTPLPGSEDHRNLVRQDVWMDPDPNNYDLNHVTTGHPRMSGTVWSQTNRLAWETYFSRRHMKTVIRRAATYDIKLSVISSDLLWFYFIIFLEKIHPLEGGIIRRKYRKDRRPGLPRENLIAFYARYAGEMAVKHAVLAGMAARMTWDCFCIRADPRRRLYSDSALKQVTTEELDDLDIFTVTPEARAQAKKMRRRETNTT